MNVLGEAEVAIVGAGPAGLAAAIACRQVGLSVAVCERRRPPLDKPCGEGLMPDALASLEALGVAIPPGLGRPFRGIRYRDSDLVAEGLFPEGETGLGLRRPQLIAALAERTEAVGARIYWGVGATALDPAGLATDGGLLRARWVVAADGLHSSLRRRAGLARRPGPQMRFGIRRHYRVRPWTDLVEVHWADHAEAYVTPVGEEEVGIAMLWGGGKERFDSLLARFPALARRVQGAPRSSEDRGAGPFDQRVRAMAHGNLALLGDAAGYLDAVTGEGMALAFAQARALAAALAGGSLAPFTRACRQLARIPLAITRLVLYAEARPRMRRRVVAALAADGELFGRLLGLMTQRQPLAALGIVPSARFLLSLIRPRLPAPTG